MTHINIRKQVITFEKEFLEIFDRSGILTPEFRQIYAVRPVAQHLILPFPSNWPTMDGWSFR